MFLRNDFAISKANIIKDAVLNPVVFRLFCQMLCLSIFIVSNLSCIISWVQDFNDVIVCI